MTIHHCSASVLHCTTYYVHQTNADIEPKSAEYDFKLLVRFLVGLVTFIEVIKKLISDFLCLCTFKRYNLK